MANTETAPRKRKPRQARDPNELKNKLQERIAKLMAQLEKKQAELTVTADPKVAGVEKRLKAAKAKLTAAKRFLTRGSQKLNRLITETADQRERLKNLEVQKAEAEKRIAELEPELERLKAGTVVPDKPNAG